MRRKIGSIVLVAVMMLTLLAGCAGTTGGKEEKDDAKKEDSGKVLNIYVWNEEFKSRITDHYPGYEVINGTTGKIGDVKVVWNITPSKDSAYQNNLDEKLLGQADAPSDEKIDIFLVEADYALKYVNSDYTMPIEDLGITDEDIKDQYTYTQDVVTDSNGKLKGLSWQGCPGVLIYNRAIAKTILGGDEPEVVQEAVKDWDTFMETAEILYDKGYSITSSVNDTYRVYSNNVTSPWVIDGTINYDKSIVQWVEDSKMMYEAGYTDAYDLWSDDWSKGFYPDGNVFCYFGPAWFVDFSMAVDTEGSIASEGGWGATTGPQGFFWGGTWICAATGTDNEELVKDIMLKLTTDKEIMTDIVIDDNDFVNNKPAMEAMAKSNDYVSKVLGGQNPLPMYCAGVETIDFSNATGYDQSCTEALQNAMKNYFLGEATYEEALELFEKAVIEKHPELKGSR